jgi:hypothetical protein
MDGEKGSEVRNTVSFASHSMIEELNPRYRIIAVERVAFQGT